MEAEKSALRFLQKFRERFLRAEAMKGMRGREVRRFR